MRWTTLLGSAAGIGVAFLIWLGLADLLRVAEPADAGERLGMACAALLPAVGVLGLMVVLQMGCRAVTGAIDPLAGRDTRFLQVNQRALANTVEQFAGYVPALLALAAGAPAAWMRFIVAGALVFSLARLAFWIGYLLGPRSRAPGMAATFGIHAGTLLAAAMVWWP